MAMMRNRPHQWWGLFLLLAVYTQFRYNVYMNKDKLLHIRIDEAFEKKLQYLMRINGFRSLSDTIRKLIEKEYRKEKE